MDLEAPQLGLGLGFPYWKPLRRRFTPESPFFASGNIERELLVKQVLLFSFLVFSQFLVASELFNSCESYELRCYVPILSRNSN